MNRLINNRETVEQLFLIVCELIGREAEIIIEPNVEVIKELKAELYQNINKTNCEDVKTGAKNFDLMFVNKHATIIEPLKDLKNTFDNDISNSIFNQIEPEQAHARGDIFFNEYLNYNEVTEKKERIKYVHKPKEVYRLPEIEF